MFIGDLMFGNNNVMLLSNDSRNGRLGNGIFVSDTVGNGTTSLCVNVNSGDGSGTCLVLCSGLLDGKPIGAAYMVRTGFKDNFIKEVHICGENKWQFSVGEGGILHAKGPSKSSYSVYHNREEIVIKEEGTKKSDVLMTQASNGEDQVTIVEKIPEHGMFFVLCSNSKGTEDRTAAALYAVMVDEGGKISAKHVSGNHGSDYRSSDLWKISAEGAMLL